MEILRKVYFFKRVDINNNDINKMIWLDNVDIYGILYVTVNNDS